MNRKKTEYNKVVVKVGTKILTKDKNSLDEKEVQILVKQVADLVKRGIDVVVVSSGAIASGMDFLDLKKRPASLPILQAAAAIGQNQLMKIYGHYFEEEKLAIAQVLLTQSDLESRKRYLNAKNTLDVLLQQHIIPIVNENDTVATEEIKFGDNDRLSALVSNLIQADILIMLTDVDGLYCYKNNKKKKINVVDKINRDVEEMAEDTRHHLSKGGMKTKIEAAKIAISSGRPCIIANGKRKGILNDIIQGKQVGTKFLPQGERLKERKKWIAFGPKPKGKIVVDKGAQTALKEKKKSLLSAGVVKIEGKFAYGDVVKILDNKGKEFARGLTNYSSGELKKIKGKKTNMIKKQLGYKYYDEIIHRDNLVILK
jgi:glutamate 5-kinase